MYILSHHKCATTWLIYYLMDFCAINDLTFWRTHDSAELAPSRHDVQLITNASYEFLNTRIEGGVHIIRNPLDIIVSAYYSHKSTHSVEGWPELTDQRHALNRVTKDEGMLLTLAFLERYDFGSGGVGPLYALRAWNFDDQRFTQLKMEEVVRNPSEVLGPLLIAKHPGAQLPDPVSYTFKAMSGRQYGVVDENSHFRSGQLDQWRSDLPLPAKEYIFAHCRRILERLYPECLEAP